MHANVKQSLVIDWFFSPRVLTGRDDNRRLRQILVTNAETDDFSNWSEDL